MRPAALLWVLVLALPACRSLGPQALRRTYPEYNASVREAVSQELLLNIVRMRYLDSIQFMSVGTVSAQFSVDLSTGIKAGVERNDTTVLPEGGVAYRDAPTLTFTPRRDSAFTKLMTQPVSTDVFLSMTTGHDGWRWALLLAATSINGAQSDVFRGKQERFDERMEILNRLAMENHFSVGAVLEDYAVSQPIAKDALRPADLIQAAEKGYVFRESAPGEVQLTKRARRLAIRVRPASLQAVRDDLEKLGLDPDQRIYIVKPPAELGALAEQASSLTIQTRSFLGMVHVMAGGVDIPCLHRRQGLVPDEALAGVPEEIKQVFRVRVCCDRPDARLAVRHRHHWFYIDDRDESSRVAFHLLALLYDLELGGEEGKDKGPVLTLPVGG